MVTETEITRDDTEFLDDAKLIEEEEIESGQPGDIHDPFNPDDIRVITKHLTIGQVVDRIEHNEMDLAPEFQRLAGVWPPKNRSRLIESILLRIPLPVFYVAANEDELWSVVDGLQRISTINAFVRNEFSLIQLEYLHSLGEKHFSDLPRQLQRRILETELVMHVIQPGTPELAMFNIFKRINTGGKPLNSQEIRHAMLPGVARKFLTQLAKLPAFLEATDNSLPPGRMADRECVLRFMAFSITPWQHYGQSELDGFLSMAMRKLNTMDNKERVILSNNFVRAMNSAKKIFGDDAFRKRMSANASRSRINKALFESWSVSLSSRTDSEIKRLEENHNLLNQKFIDLMQNQEFFASISQGTGSRRAVETRFKEIDRIVQETIDA
ncbi:MAG: DUF262 domain-containing protein [Rhizobiaceae bacterium]|nr:DUF262 domain-containing protein [Rhizobiaceae bacterium]